MHQTEGHFPHIEGLGSDVTLRKSCVWCRDSGGRPGLLLFLEVLINSMESWWFSCKEREKWILLVKSDFQCLSFQGWDSKATDAGQGPRGPHCGVGGQTSLFSCSHHPFSFTFLFSSLHSYGTQTYLGDFNCWEKWRKPVFYHGQAHSYVSLYILGESHCPIIFVYF